MAVGCRLGKGSVAADHGSAAHELVAEGPYTDSTKCQSSVTPGSGVPLFQLSASARMREENGTKRAPLSAKEVGQEHP